jgi:hypothetical protein
LGIGSRLAGGGGANTSLVLRCERTDGSAAMLKLVPDRSLAVAEATSLRSWESSGRVPAVWGYDAHLGALLLEAIPGETPVSESGRQVAVPELAGEPAFDAVDWVFWNTERGQGRGWNAEGTPARPAGPG